MENSANLLDFFNLCRILTIKSNVSQTIHLFCKLLLIKINDSFDKGAELKIECIINESIKSWAHKVCQ